MGRRLDCVPRNLGCRNCECGNHRGCVMTERPAKKVLGAYIPWERRVGVAKQGCPCITEDDERIAQEEAEDKAAAEEEEAAEKAAAEKDESERLRVLAIEKALWGKTFEGSLTTDRPKIRTLGESDGCDEALPSLDKKRRVD